MGTKRSGREVLRLHPDDADARGLSDGDVVRVFNDRGACLAAVAITDGVRAGVAVLPVGSAHPLEPGDPDSLRHGTLTCSLPTARRRRCHRRPPPRARLVEVRWTGELPPVRAHTPPELVDRP
ncbi:MAG: molybdopterin dinucleotide binding domain-containing protein [Acidimicrobiales bacterium]